MSERLNAKPGAVQFAVHPCVFVVVGSKTSIIDVYSLDSGKQWATGPALHIVSLYL
jgi:hypothetical protein